MKFFFSRGNNRFASCKIKEEKTEEEKQTNMLLDDLRKAKEALETAYNGFDNVVEPDLIDCYIYELNSVITRYDYLLEQVRKLANKETIPPRPVPVVVASDDKPLYSEVTGHLPV